MICRSIVCVVVVGRRVWSVSSFAGVRRAFLHRKQHVTAMRSDDVIRRSVHLVLLFCTCAVNAHFNLYMNETETWRLLGKFYWIQLLHSRPDFRHHITHLHNFCCQPIFSSNFGKMQYLTNSVVMFWGERYRPPLIQLNGLGSAVSSPSWVLGKAPGLNRKRILELFCTPECLF